MLTLETHGCSRSPDSLSPCLFLLAVCIWVRVTVPARRDCEEVDAQDLGGYPQRGYVGSPRFCNGIPSCPSPEGEIILLIHSYRCAAMAVFISLEVGQKKSCNPS